MVSGERMSMNNRRTLFLIVFATWLSCGVAAGFADTFEFSGDRTEIVLAEGRERTLLTGNAVIRSGSLEIRAGEIELSGDGFRYAECRGGVRAEDSEEGLLIDAEEFFYDRRNDLSRAEGDVVLEDRDNDLVLRAGYVESREDGALLLAQIAVRIFRDDLTARAQFLRYRRSESTLELSGFPVVYWKGDEYRATRIVLNLDTEEVELQGRVQGEIVIEEEEETGQEGQTGETGKEQPAE